MTVRNTSCQVKDRKHYRKHHSKHHRKHHIGDNMAIERTYSKRGNTVFVREIERLRDTEGTEFVVKDTETAIDHEQRITQLNNGLVVVREEIAELQVDEANLVARIADIETARDL